MDVLERDVKSDTEVRLSLEPHLRGQQAGGRLKSFPCVAAHVVAACLTIGCTRPEVPVLQTPELAGASPELRFRMESEGSGRLLIKNPERDGVYLYDPGLRSLSLVPVERWQSASGQVGDTCGINFDPKPFRYGELHFGERGFFGGRRLFLGDRHISTAGRVALVFNRSSQDNFVAVLSADDRFRLPPLFPFLAGPGPPTGQHYHQVFSVPELRPPGHRTPVAFRANVPVMICWSPDERYVIYTDLRAGRMCIVPNEGKGTE